MMAYHPPSNEIAAVLQFVVALGFVISAVVAMRKREAAIRAARRSKDAEKLAHLQVEQSEAEKRLGVDLQTRRRYWQALPFTLAAMPLGYWLCVSFDMRTGWMPQLMLGGGMLAGGALGTLALVMSILACETAAAVVNSARQELPEP